MADRPLRPATHRRLGRPLPHQQANGPRAHPVAEAEASFPPRGTSGISPGFPGLSLSTGQITHVLLTRSRLCPGPKPGSSLHLHVLSTPPAFVLSQDQTLRERPAPPGGVAGTASGRVPRDTVGHKELSWPGAASRTPDATTMTGQLMPTSAAGGRVGRTCCTPVPHRDRGARMLLSFQRPPRLPGGGLPPSARPSPKTRERIEQYSALWGGLDPGIRGPGPAVPPLRR